MSTTIIDPRPDQFTEQAGPGQFVMASAFDRAWQTIGNAYEQLTLGVAPGNALRTVPVAHDHQAGFGFGAFLAQPPMRWQGIGGVGSRAAAATVPPFALASIYAWAAMLEVYTKQELTVVVYGKRGNGDGVNEPGQQPAGLQLEMDGIDGPFGFEPSQDPEYWMIAAGLGLVNAGTHTLALRIDALAGAGEFWTVQGAEVWAASGEQIRLGP